MGALDRPPTDRYKGYGIREDDDGRPARPAAAAVSPAAGPPDPSFRILGTVSVAAEGAELRIGGVRQRALLALLLLEPAVAVPVDRLADELWLGAPPPGAATTIRSYVSRLRSALGAGSIHPVSGGYRLTARPEQIDARQFERLLQEGSRALADGSTGRAAQQLHAALALWRGEHALADVCGSGALATEARRLDELRLVCLEERVDADLALGREVALAEELRAQVQRTPLRERLWCQLAMALYRCGRQAEALDALREARELLERELGIDPGEHLRRTEVAILRHDLALSPHPREQVLLPASTTSFVGRTCELAELDQLLRAHRLVTITGLGGSGKTRLAVQVARLQQPYWASGVCWVDLTALADAALVPGAIAEVLDVPDRRRGSTVDALLSHLSRQELLLAIDNCEHLVTSCAQLIDAVLRACPNVHVLATSRMPLGIPGEHDYALDPLPAAGTDLEPSPAVQLFIDRAGAVRRGLRFEAGSLELAARICRELDGLPLAIELAAAQARCLSLAEIAGRLDDRFRFLRSAHRVAPARHRTLATAMDWSFELLGPDDKQLLRRLSVFAGGATLAAVAEVCVSGDEATALELLTRLVDASLVRAEVGEPTRYRLLETVRQYAAAKLAHDSDADEVRGLHAEYFLRLAEDSNMALDSLGHGPQRHEPVLRDQHNLRAALDWTIDTDVPTAARLALALENFWITQALAEGERRLGQILARAEDLDLVLRARLTRDHAACLDVLQDYARARAEYERSRELFALAGDTVGVATLDYRLGLVTLLLDEDIEVARRLWQASLETFRTEHDPIGELQTLGDLGRLEVAAGNVATGTEMIETSIEMARRAGWWWWAARGEGRLAAFAAAAGRAEEAERRGHEFLAFAWRSGNRQETLHALAILARAAASRGDDDRALALWASVAASDDGPGRFGRFDRAEYAATMPPRPLPPPLSLDQAVRLALSR